MHGTNDYEDIPHTECEPVSKLSAQESHHSSGNHIIHTEGQEERPQHGYESDKNNPNSEFRKVVDPKCDMYIHNSTYDCMST